MNERLIMVEFKGQELDGCLGTVKNISYYPENLLEKIKESGMNIIGSINADDQSAIDTSISETSEENEIIKQEPEVQSEQTSTLVDEDKSQIDKKQEEEAVKGTEQPKESQTPLEEDIQYEEPASDETGVSVDDRFEKPSEILNNLDEMVFSQMNTEIDVEADLSNPTVALMYAQQKSTLGTLLIVLGKAKEEDKVKVRELYKRYLDGTFYQEHDEELNMLLENANENIAVAKQIEAIKQVMIDEYRKEKDEYLEEVYQRASREFDDLNLPSLQNRMDDEEERQKSHLREGNAEAGFIADVLNKSALEEFARLDNTPDFVSSMLQFLRTKEEYAEYIKQAELLQPHPVYVQPQVEKVIQPTVATEQESESSADAELVVSSEEIETPNKTISIPEQEEIEEQSSEIEDDSDNDEEELDKEDSDSDETSNDEEDDEEDSDYDEDQDDEESDEDDEEKEEKSNSGSFLASIGLGSMFSFAKKKTKKSKSNDEDDEEDFDDLDDPDDDLDDDGYEEIVEETPKKSKKRDSKKKLPIIPIVASVLTVVTIGGGVAWMSSLNDTNGNSAKTEQTSKNNSNSETESSSETSESETTSSEEYTAENHYGFKVGDSVDVTVEGTEANATITEFDKDGNALAMTSGGNTVLISSETLKDARVSKTGVFK